MPELMEIKSTAKTDHDDPQKRIKAIGGINLSGTQWKLTMQRAIQDIEAGKWQFYARVGNRTVDVVVAVHEGEKYLKTTLDDVEPEGLLALPECPA